MKLVSLTIAALLVACTTLWSQAAEIPWELTPYRVEIRLHGTDISQSKLQDIGRKVEQLLHIEHPAAWLVSVTSTPHYDGGGWMLGEATPAANPEVDAAIDKLIAVSISETPNECRLLAREWDAATSVWSPIVERRCHAQQLDVTAARIVAGTFSPLVRLDPPDRGGIAGRVRAAGLVTRAESPLLLLDNDALIPVLRRSSYTARDLPPGEVVPWTVLAVNGVDGGKIRCQVHSARRRPIPGRSSMRLKRYALRLPTTGRGTRLVVQSPQPNQAPLASYEVLQRAVDAEETTLLGVTNHRGEFVVPSGDTPWRLLYIRNGTQLLARLPIVPGWRPEMTVTLNDDGPRLAAEAHVVDLKQQLVQTVAQRQLLAARFRARLKEQDSDAAQRILQSIRELPSRDDYARRLQDARRTIVSSNPTVQKRIDLLLQEHQSLLRQHLDPGLIDVLEAELRRST